MPSVLEMQDAGFHYSGASEFRRRLLADEQEESLLQTMLDRFKVLKLWKAGGKQKQHSDLTHMLAAGRRCQHQLELVHETLPAYAQ